MSTRSALTVVGQVVGAYFGGAYGAAIGGFIGGEIGGAIDGPVRNQQALIDDLDALKFDYGSAWPRIYGAYKFKVSPMWSSTKRPVGHEEEVDSKGTPAAVNTTFTYVMDWWCWAPLNATGFSRIWVNGKLRFSKLADADDETIAASLKSGAWSSVKFFDGNPAQMPWTVYEAAVGTDNAMAMRHRPSIAFADLDLPGGNPPLIEVEFYSSANEAGTISAEMLFKASIGDPDEGIHPFSGVGNYVPGSGNTNFVGDFGGNYERKNFYAIVYDPTSPAPHFEVRDFGVLPDSVGEEANFISGMSDETYWMTAGQVGPFEVRITDMFGFNYPANYPLDPTAFWVAIKGYARYDGGTLGLISGFIADPNFSSTGGIGLGSIYVGLSYLPHAAVKAGPEWWVWPHFQSGAIYRYDAITLGDLGSFPDPRGGATGSSSGGIPMRDTADPSKIYFLFGDKVYLWEGPVIGWTLYMDDLPTECRGLDQANVPSGAAMTNGELFSFYYNVFETDASEAETGVHSVIYEYWVARSASKAELLTVTLSSIVQAEELLEWSGEAGALTAGMIDVSELTAIAVTGFATSGSPRESVGQLADVYYFGGRVSDKFYHPRRGAASIGTVPFDQTGMGVGEAGTPFTGMQRGNDVEVPIQISITGPNPLTDYEPGTENSDRLVGESVSMRPYTTPVVFTPAERKGRADTMVYDGRYASHSGTVVLDDRHVEKEPFDVWNQVDDQGNTYRVRSVGETFADSVHSHEVVLDDATILSSSGITTATDQRAVTVAPVPLTAIVPLDIPLLREADDTRGIYVAAQPSASRGWSGWGFFESADGGTTYTKLGGGTKAGVFGSCSAVPADFDGGYTFNDFGTIVVNVGLGALGTASRADVLADETVNAFAIGAHGRWCLGQFCKAELLSAGVYRVSGLLMGARGTERYIGTQVEGDKFVLLRATGGIVRMPQYTADHGAERRYKGVSVGASLDSVGYNLITEQEVGLMPLSVFAARSERNVDGDLGMSWERRSRLATNAFGPTGPIIPLGEEAERYEVDVFEDDTYATVVRTLATTTNSVLYTGDDQTVDFGSPQAVVYRRIYQISGRVGRGFPNEGAS